MQAKSTAAATRTKSGRPKDSDGVHLCDMRTLDGAVPAGVARQTASTMVDGERFGWRPVVSSPRAVLPGHLIRIKAPRRTRCSARAGPREVLLGCGVAGVDGCPAPTGRTAELN